MKFFTPHRQADLKAGVAFAAFFGFASVAIAQEVNLRSADGAIDLTGTFITFNEEFYVIETPRGELRVAVDRVTCSGDACPAKVEDTAQVVAWDVSLWGQRRAFTEHVEKLSELVSAKTAGAFTLNIAYGGLSDSRENLDGISAGAFEMAQFCAGYHPSKNPSITVLELPFLGVKSLEDEIDLSMAVYQHPATQADMARWNATLLMPSPLPQYNIVGTGKLPLSLSDFEGMKIRATGGIGDAVASLGAVLASIPATEVRSAMEDGRVDAVSFAPHAHMSFGTIDNASWWTTNLNPGTVNCPVVVNTDALEGLPETYRDALLSSVDEALDHYVTYYNGETMDAWGPALAENEIIELTINDQIRASIKQAAAEPTATAWIAETTALGLPAQELYDLVTRMIAQFP